MSPTGSTGQGVIVRAVATLLAGVVVLWTLYAIRGPLLIIYISGLLALGFTPMVRWLERRRWRMPRWIAILVVYFGLMAVAIASIAIVVPPLVAQAMQLRDQLPAYLARLEGFLLARGIIDHEITLSDALTRLPTAGAGAAVPFILAAVGSALGTIGSIVAILVLPYYLLIEADQIQSGFLRLFPAGRRPMIARITRDVTFKVAAWLNGQLILALIIGTATSFCLWLIGVPYFYVLGFLAGLGEFIPIIGPIMSAVPAALVGFSVSVPTGLMVVAYFGLMQFVEGNILVPRIMERQVGVSSWSVIVALLIGGELLGLVGAILAVPSVAIVQVFMHEYLRRHEER
jgi:predicted PurR-regulated permease PerM